MISPKYGFDPENVVKMITSLPNFAEINSLAYMHTVVPNLRGLGLITERTEDRWRDLVMISSNPDYRAAMEPLG